ncbi:M48 family metalloprotease [Halobacterium sp. NMX12-1]|jgi:STE24 endopeptidase|uniref:M48 family metalloprotease n=1 Tax=Halobacterium sp. NMX12-1 TaxID=3166650 RepID=A0AAU8CGB8_9EURY
MHAAVVLALPVLAYAASRLAGAAAVRAADRVTAASRLRRANRLLQAAAALVGLFVFTDSEFADALAAALPAPDAASAFGVLAATVLVGGVLPALAVHLGTRPAWAAVTGNATDYAATVRRFLAFAAVLVAPALFVVGAWLAAPSGTASLLAVVGAAAVVAVALPSLAARFGPVREPTAAEAAVVPACADGLRVRVVETGNHPVANAVAAGVLPGARYVFVTDALFRTLDADATTAVLAHEVAHHRRGHVLARFLATGVALAPIFLAANGVVEAFVPAIALSAALLLAVGPLVRWTEFDADAYAAARVGDAAMERALATLADRGLVPTERSRLARLFSFHPAVGRRRGRLR